MRIYDVRVNGLKNPLGYAFRDVVLSWKTEADRAKHQRNAAITIAYDREFTRIAARAEGNLTSNAQKVELELKPRTQYFARIFAEGENGEKAVSETVTFETGKREEPWRAHWISMEERDRFHPVFEKQVHARGSVKKARLYICGLGLYEVYLNGKKAGENYLAPFFNDYHLALQSQTYDVTEMLGTDNRFCVMLGNGWYKGRLGYEGGSEVFGNKFTCIAELHMEYEDGTREVVCTDESWVYYGSDIEYSDIYDGEGINRLLYENRANERKRAVILTDAPGRLTDCYSMTLKEMEELTVKEILHTPAGETVLDFGQNFAGYVAFHAAFPKGTRVVLTHGEVLQNGNFYHDNYRSAKTEITYTSDGREEWVRPHFTYTGFRYVKVDGWPGQVKKEDFIGCAVYSAMERTGYLETGNEKINQLISNALWGLKSNFLDMPTDCPQRDERLGWTGDAQVFAPTASFFMDTKAFYRKFLWDMRGDQVRQGGAVANYLPNITRQPGGSSVWGDAAVFIPETVFDTFGDRAFLEEAYPLMRDWLEWIRKGDKARPGGPKYLFDYGFTFGDWLAMDGVTEQSFKGGTEDAYISTVYYYASAKKVARAAGILGKEKERAEYEHLARQIRKAVLNEYFTPSGRLAMDTQTGYIIALYFGIYNNKKAVCDGLKKRLRKDGYRIKCGFVGAPLLCETLAENGMEEIAFHILLQEEFPGWLHCVNLGATTIWERWNSILDDGSISGTGMNSLNHYAYGSVVNYIKSDIAGLKPIEPGYRRVRIAPRFDIRLGYLNCTYKSASGTYEANWKINRDGTVSVHYEVPFGCEARVNLPGYEKPELCLEAGITDITYRPSDRNYRRLYGWNSLLEDLRKDRRAMKILKEELPKAYEMAMGEDMENLTVCMEDMKGMGFFGLFPENVDKAAEKLFLLEPEAAKDELVISGADLCQKV